MRYPKPEVDRDTAMRMWQMEHSDYAKEQVFLNNVGMIGVILKSLNLNPLDEDLFQIGAIGLMGAIESFDPDKGFRFSTYATPYVRNEILESIRIPKKRITKMVSLEKEIGEDGTTLQNMISSGERFEDLSVLKIDLENCMKKLSDRERYVLTSLANGETQASIGRSIGTSRENVRRILKEIKRKIRY